MTTIETIGALIVAVSAISTKAISDGLRLRAKNLLVHPKEMIPVSERDKKYKRLLDASHMLAIVPEALLLGALIGYGGVTTQDMYLGFGYVLTRFALFDPLYNISAGLPLWYIGSTSIFDRVINKFKAGKHILWVKFIAIIAGISLLLKKK